MKIKSKLVKSTINNKNILDTFQELLGTNETNVNPSIAHPKYNKLQNNVNRFIKLLSMFRDSSAMLKFPNVKGILNNYIFLLLGREPGLFQYCEVLDVGVSKVWMGV